MFSIFRKLFGSKPKTKPKRTKVTPELLAKLDALVAGGLTPAAACRKVGVSRQTYDYHIQKRKRKSTEPTKGHDLGKYSYDDCKDMKRIPSNNECHCCVWDGEADATCPDCQGTGVN